MEEQLVRQIEQARRNATDEARPGLVATARAQDRFTARERIAALVDSTLR